MSYCRFIDYVREMYKINIHFYVLFIDYYQFNFYRVLRTHYHNVLYTRIVIMIISYTYTSQEPIIWRINNFQFVINKKIFTDLRNVKNNAR